MANRWGIPKQVEDFVKQRDTNCVYCGQEFFINFTVTLFQDETLQVKYLFYSFILNCGGLRF